MSVLESLAEAREALEGGATPGELLTEAVRRCRELDAGESPVNAFLSLRDPEADAGPVAAAEQDGGGLTGVPVAVKDNLCTLAEPTTCGSRILEGYRSPYAATAVRRLQGAGARLVGKTNMDEFAMGSSTENSAFGPTRNPLDPERVPGGSSGGSAAAVAAGVVPVALGSSTGGSVRQPAAFCGVVGVKPTYGRVSRYGLVAFASSLDQVGVVARSVADAATVLETISGFDPRDATCQDRPVPRARALDDVELRDRTLGLPVEYLSEGLDHGVRERVEAVVELARDAGAEVREVSLPSTSHAIPCYYVLAPAEASSNLARYDGVRYGRRAEGAASMDELHRRSRGEGLGPEVKRRIMLGTYALSAGYYEAFYVRAQRLRARLAGEFERLFRDEGVDAVMAPTTPTPAFRLGEKTTDPYEMYLNDVYTVSANLAGLPAVSIPAGTAAGMPVGVQLMAPRWREETMMGLAARLEERIGWEHPLPDGPGG